MAQPSGWQMLDLLVGEWHGRGTGEFPTIAPFSYREVLSVQVATQGAALHYLQRTWRLDGTDEFDSHIETGFMNLAEGGGIEVLNAQGSDRVEVLRGVPVLHQGKLILELVSVVLEYDDRMVSSWRKLEVDGSRLHYDMGMATKDVPGGDVHLTADLTRQ